MEKEDQKISLPAIDSLNNSSDKPVTTDISKDMDDPS